MHPRFADGVDATDMDHCPALDVTVDTVEWTLLFRDAEVWQATLPREDWHPLYRDVLRTLKVEANAFARSENGND